MGNRTRGIIMFRCILLLCIGAIFLAGCNTWSALAPASPMANVTGVPDSAPDVGVNSPKINKSLEDDERHLNEVFNFRALILNNNVLPPVLSQGRDALDVDNPDAL